VTEKTKAKIEAMAYKHSRCEPPVMANNALSINRFYGVVDGAKPWAEWCERLEEKLACNCDFLGYQGALSKSGLCSSCEIKKEYNQWLEDTEQRD